jgi:hypothetical protein
MAHGESSAKADYAGGKWTKAPYNAVELSMGNLSPEQLGQTLLGAGNDPLAKKTVMNGAELQADAWGGSNAIHIVMVTTFMRDDGDPVSSCTDSVLATSKILTSFSCRTSGDARTKWYRSHDRGFAVRALAVLRATVNSAQDIAAMLATLTREQQTA